MDDLTKHDDGLTARIESGEYYREAREWYDIVYIAPISQRIFYIIVCCCTVATFVMSIVSVTNLLPLSPREPFVYMGDNVLIEIPKMIRFAEPNEDANPALMRYFLNSYVEKRESYSEFEYLLSRAYVRAYSTPEEFREFDAATNPRSAQSPIRRYGRGAKIVTTIDDSRLNLQAQPFEATIDFSTEVLGVQRPQKTNWTATIRFDYTFLVERDSYDETLGDYVLDFDEPSFKILQYEARERLGTRSE